MRTGLKIALLASALVFTGQVQAATHAVSLQGNVANFTNLQQDTSGLHLDRYFFPLSFSSLSVFGSYDPITVAQGDTINAVVTFDQLLTIPSAPLRTDFFQFYSGEGFTGGPTTVSGTLNFFSGGELVKSLDYESSSAFQLASWGIAFAPDNDSFSFDSFTNDLTIVTLDQPATLTGSVFNYNLVSTAVPEPATWALMITGFGLIGGAARRRRPVQVIYA